MTKKYIPKPSELPCYSVIEQIDGDPNEVYTVGQLFMVDSNGDWSLCYARDAAHADANDVQRDKADARFDNYKIVATPPDYVFPKIPRRKLIWKDIPGFPQYQISDNLTVRAKNWRGYSRRNNRGGFNLYVNGKAHHWHESQLGDAEAIKKFFEN